MKAKWSFLLCAFVTSLLLIRVLTAQQTQPSDSPVNHLQNRVKMAEQVVKILEEREAGGEAQTPTFIMLKLDWNRRLLEARIEAASTVAEKRAIAAEYIDVTKRQHQLIFHIKDLQHPDLLTSITNYDISNAECLLDKLKSN